MRDYIWVVGIAIADGRFVPLTFYGSREEARRDATDKRDRKLYDDPIRVRKYVEE